MGAAGSSVKTTDESRQLATTLEGQGSHSNPGHGPIGLGSSDESPLQARAQPANTAQPSVTEQSRSEAQHRGIKRQREPNEQPGPPLKRYDQSVGPAKLTAAVVGYSHGSTSLPIRVSQLSKASAPPLPSAEPVSIQQPPARHDGSSSPRHYTEFRDHPGSQSLPADLATAYDGKAYNGTAETPMGIVGDLPRPAVQTAASLASDTDLLDSWRIAPEPPLSDFQRQQNRRVINKAVMRLRPLMGSDSYVVRSDDNHNLFAKLDAGTRKRKPEDNRVDFVQKAKAVTSKGQRRGVQGGRVGSKLVMPVSKKRRRASEDVGGRSKSDVYNVAQADRGSSPVDEEVAGRQRVLHGLWRSWPGMLQENWE